MSGTAARAVASSRDEGRRLGLKRYRGEPCKHGHDGLRYVVSDDCAHCAAARSVDSRNRRHGGLWLVHGRVKLPEELADGLIRARILPEAETIVGADVVNALRKMLDALGSIPFRNNIETKKRI